MIDRHIETKVGGYDAIPDCKYPGCQEKIAGVVVDYGYFDFCVEKYFSEQEWDIKKKEVREYTNNAIVFCNLRYCPKHEEEQFQPILDSAYQNDSKNKPTLSGFYTQKINEHEWDMIYTQICKNKEDRLLKSCRELYAREEENNSNNNLERNSEFRWFTDLNYYSVPVRWKKDFIVDTYLGTTSAKQGKYNGPDFVLLDTKSKKKFGFEIFELNPTEFYLSGIRNPEKVMEKLNKQVNKERGGSFYKNFNTACMELDRKIKKWSKYISVDEKAVGIIMNGSVPDEWYYFLELLINNTPKYANFFYWVYLL